jgi:DsbC/DsbD-like thiol-disulfide interchange protein
MSEKAGKGPQSVALLLALMVMQVGTAGEQAQPGGSAGEMTGPVRYTFAAPKLVSAGKEFDVKVVFDMAAGWHIYAPTGRNAANGMIETTVKFDVPEGIETVGAVLFPEGEVFYGKGIEMVQTLQAKDGVKSGKYSIDAKVRYQTCNADMCLPPVTETVSAVIEVK